MPHIAIPLPHSSDPDYAQRSIPQYERAVELAGGKPVRIPLDQPAAELLKMIARCDAVLLPGSKADVDPEKFHAQRSPHTAAADAARNAVDELLLTNAYRLRKPVFGICYGLQSLNVFCSGSLVQHIPDFLPEAVRNHVNHEAGKTVTVAHDVEIEKASQLAKILCRDSRPRLSRAQLGGIATAPVQKDRSVRYAFKSAANAASPPGKNLILPVNSSHHQSAETIGHGLRIVARCPADGIIEALEGTADDHFVLAVQWHPERSVDQDEPSRTLFRAFVEAAEEQSKKYLATKQRG